MSNLRLNKIKSQTPISILLHGGNRVGYLTAKALIEQGCYVIIVDKFNSETKKYLSELKKSELFDFFDFRGFNSLFKTLKRFDYLFYFLGEKITKQEEFDSKDFLNETRILEDSLLGAKKYNAKFSLITSLALNRELANRVNNEKLSTPTPYSNIELQKYCETLAAEFKDKSNLNLRILRLGTIIGKGVDKINSNVLHSLFKDATQKTQITIKGEGLDVHNLIHEEDAKYGILKLTFADSTKGEVISLANKNNYTTLSLAYKLLELNTEALSIKFVEDPGREFVIQDLYVPAPPATKYTWSQQVPLEEAMVEQIQNYYDMINKEWELENRKVKKEEVKENVSVSRTGLGNFLATLYSPLRNIFKRKERGELNIKKSLTVAISSVLLLLLTYFVVYPIVGLGLGLFLINASAKNLTASILDTEGGNLENEISSIERNLNRMEDSLGNLYWFFSLTGMDELYDNSNRLLLGAQYAIQGTGDLFEATEPLLQYIEDFEPALSFQTDTATTTREYREYLQEIERNRYRIDDANYKVEMAYEIITTLNTPVFPQFLQNDILELKSLVTDLQQLTSTFRETSTFLPELLGVNERRRYLILFQNEGEIRGTGGWLTSYGIVGIEGGQIRELFVDDIYNAEGTLRLQGKTYTPPRSMVSGLEVTNWTFSLLNWSPDLSETLINSEQYIKDLGKGNRVDGIVTINISFLQNLLREWGGIEVPGESELITEENIYSKIFEMHEDFVPGSTQKTTFMANLANEIVQKVLSMHIAEMMQMGDILENSLQSKHIQATFRNNDAFEFFKTRNWGGSIDSRHFSAPVAIDWNWGGNKANLYLEKNYNLAVDIKDIETIEYTYTITTQNKSTSNTYPEGDYINYQRIYIPTEATVLSVLGMENNEYDIYKEGGFKVIGGWFNTAVGEISNLEISYSIENNSNMPTFPISSNEQNVFYTLQLFKQSGESSNAYKIDITYPSTWILQNSGNLNSISNQLSGRLELNEDLSFPITWRIPN